MKLRGTNPVSVAQAAVALASHLPPAAVMNGTSADDGRPAELRRRAQPGSAEYGSPPLEFEADPGGDLAYTA